MNTQSAFEYTSVQRASSLDLKTSMDADTDLENRVDWVTDMHMFATMRRLETS